MHFKDSVAVAFHCMRVSRLRTVLTMLGIVISVSAVTVLASMAGSVDDAYRTAFDTLGKSVIVTPSAAATVGGNGPRSLSDADVEALRRDSRPSGIADVVPIVSSPTMMRRGGENYLATVVGASSGYLVFKNVSLVAGRIFTDREYRSNSRVVLLGPALVKWLFGGDPAAAVGATVLVGRIDFRVIGLLGPDGQGDTTALMPMTTARAFLFGGMRTVQSVGVVATNMDAVGAASKEINRILDRQHFVKDLDQRDYNLTSAEQDFAILHRMMFMLFWFIIAVTGMALFIGALGLANIMLITVTERTCEIGVRRAIGARRGAILRQFLIESVIIAGFGGLIGVAAGVGLMEASQHILSERLPLYGEPHASISAAGLAFGLSLLIGLGSGGYPAMRASRLQPWDALRS